jgi:hypothetical protein
MLELGHMFEQIGILLSNSHPRRILGVDFTFAWSQEEEEE